MSNTKIFIKLTLVMLFWGSAFVSGRVLAQSYHPFTVSFLRFLTASLVMLPLLIAKYKNPFNLSFKNWLTVISLALTGVFLYNFFFFKGLALVEAGKSSVIISMNPAVSAFMAAILFKEEITSKKFAGVLFSLFGVLFVVTRGNPLSVINTGLGVGEVALFFAVFSWVSYTLIGKWSAKSLDTIQATCFAVILGTLMLFPFAYTQDLTVAIHNASLSHWLHFLILGVLCTSIGFVWFLEAVSTIGVTEATSFINLVPIFGIVSGVIFLNEKVEMSLILGTVIIILGILLINMPKKKIIS